MSPTPRTKRIAARTVAAGIAAFMLATAGIALAATGNLPGNGQGNGFGKAEDPGTGTVVESEAPDENDQGEDEGDSLSDDVTDETEGDDSSESTLDETEATPKGPRGLCRAITVGNKAEQGKALEATSFVALAEAAGGIENVEAYCTELFGEWVKPAKAERPEKPTKSKPEHPSKPDHPAKPDNQKPEREEKDHPVKP